MLEKIKASILQVLRILDNATENLPDGSAGDVKAVMISGGELRKMERVLEDVDDMIADMIKYEQITAQQEQGVQKVAVDENPDFPWKAIDVYERLSNIENASQDTRQLAMRIAARVAFGVEV